MNSAIRDTPPAHGEALFKATIKSTPEDFRVAEQLDLQFSGAGEHLLLLVEKTAVNTDEVASVIQECFAVASADIGLCGLKDRYSVSSQWFSVRTPLLADTFEEAAVRFNAAQLTLGESASTIPKQIRLLRYERHSRKLKRGAHQANRFVITLRDVLAVPTHGVSAEHLSSEPGAGGESVTALQVLVSERLATISKKGFPSYIGSQRFGRGGQNLVRARQWFAKPRKRTSRQQRSLWLSAARSEIFNAVCAARVREASWDVLLEGEPAVLDGSRSFFATGANADTGNGVDNTSEASETKNAASLDTRVREFDIHPSAPWWGRGRSPAQGVCADFEAELLKPYSDLCNGLERAGLSQERRALRSIAQNLTYQWEGPNTLELSFSLSPGVFATTALCELCHVVEPER